MTEKERIEKFKSHNLVVNCKTEDEAKKFFDWCYENGFKWDVIWKNRNIWYNENTCYRFCENDTLSYSNYIDYSNRGFEIITYEDFFKENEMTNLDYLIKNIENSKKEDNVCRVVYELKNRHRCYRNCYGCEFHTTNNVLRYLAEKHSDKIKVTQFEYDLIDSLKKTYSAYSKDRMNKFPIFTHMKEKGYFKNIENLKRFCDVYERLEVENV